MNRQENRCNVLVDGTFWQSLPSPAVDFFYMGGKKIHTITEEKAVNKYISFFPNCQFTVCISKKKNRDMLVS